MELFKSAVTFTDIHFGMKNNSKEHNEDCIKFIDFMIAEAKLRNVKTCIFMGDYFHNRSHVNISTLDYGINGIRLLNDNFESTYFIVGNHDMYYKNKRDITSINLADDFPNVHFIKDMTTIEDCTFIPFMIDEEYKNLPNIKSKYIFGHLELPGFLLNKMIAMQDHGKETENSFQGNEYVFSGHFHKRQQKTTKHGVKIVYTGNCFPHNFADSWDDDRGIMIIEHSKTPEFIQWKEAPKYRDCKLSEFLREPRSYLKDNVFIKIQIDVAIDVDDLKFVKEIFSALYNIREYTIQYLKTSVQSANVKENDVASTASIDEIVIAQIRAIDSNTLDIELLEQIYTDL